jgi:hypothetical protein
LSASPQSTGHASLGGVDPAADRKLLVLELKVSNRSPQDSLHYAGLNGFVDERAAALLVDNLGQRYLPLPAADGAAPRRVAEFDIAPGHSLTDVLIFTAPDESFEFVKLALPNVSIGRSGAVGFLIRRETIGQAEALPE